MPQFRVLGPIEVLHDGAPVTLGGRNQRAVLALLLLRANEAVSTERLVDQLWGEHPPRTATTSLQNTVAQLRKLIGPGVLHTRSGGYLLELDADELDLLRFEALARSARDAEPPERAQLLREALGLWRGPALADLGLETFAQDEIRRLEEMRLAAIEDRIDAELALGAGHELAPELEALVRAHPRDERLCGQLMLALYRAGRQADALSAYHNARRTLVEELGIEPGPELQQLYGAILRQERTLVRLAQPSLDDHYDEVLRAFSAGRLVPVLGPGVGGVAGHELATLLAERFELDGGERGLAWVSQAVAARNGIGPLHDELHLALDRDFEPSPLHAWLASLPPLLRRRNLQQQLIVTTCFDTRVERAFEAAEEELDVVSYVASGRERGKFLHIRPGGDAAVIEEPNAYDGLALESRSVLLKVHGNVDSDESRERESFAVSEDDHIDYLAGMEAAGTVPVQIAARLRRSHLLFLGYAVDDWSLRVFLRRVWGHDRLAYRSWAVQPAAEALARELWHERGVEAYEVGLDGYSQQLARVTAELAELDAAV